MNITPKATPPTLVSMDPQEPKQPERPQADEAAAFRQLARNAGINLDETRPRVVLRFPMNPNDMLLSGSLVGGQALSGRAVCGGCDDGEGPRGNVRDPSLLALADAGACISSASTRS